MHAVVGALAILFLFLSGALGLVYEIAWIRKASLVFGTASFALSTVLAVFFGGLALGSWLFGGLSARVARPLRLYGLLEAGIGVLALASPLAFRAVDGVYGWLYPAIYESFGLLSAVRLLGIAGVLLPPAVLMGGTLPLFCAQFVRNELGIARWVGLLYATNTFGAVLGCVACGFWLIPRLGVDASIRLAAVANLGIGLLMASLPMPSLPPAGERGGAAGPRAAHPSRGAILPVLFFATGWVALANEVLWSRHLSLIFHNTVYTYTITLTVILAGIVVGSLAGAPLFDRLRRRALVFGTAQVVTGILVASVLRLPPSFWERRSDLEGLAAQVGIAFAVLFAPALLSGLSFPLAIRMAVNDPARAGEGVGRMAALNTAGGIAGSLATGFLILPALGLSKTLTVVSGASVAIGVASWLFLDPTLGRRTAGLLAASALALWLAIPFALGTRLPQDYLARGRPLLAFREGLGANLAVVRDQGVETLEIDRLWQGERRKTHQVMAAHVPMLLAPRAERVLVVGLGPGQTASRFLLYEIERLDCVEIERELLPLVRDYFDAAWMDDPRVRFVVEDGRNFLTHTGERYDVISIEIGQVFRPRLAGFYTEDFYRQARERLREDGILAQFVPLGYFTPDQLRTVVQSFLTVFPQSLLWYNKSELLLVGTNGERLQLPEERLEHLERHAAVREDLAFSPWGGTAHWLNRREVFLGGFLLGPEGLRRLAGDAETYRDDRPWLEYETSHRGAAAEEKIVAELQALAEPVDPLLEAPLADPARARVAAIRRSNLRDIRAAQLVWLAEHPQATGGPDRLTLLRSALQWNPDHLWARIHLADELRRRGDPYAASDEARRAVALDPTLPRARVELGAALAATGDLAASIPEYEEALRLAPELAAVHLALAELLRVRGDVEAAIAHYRSGIEASPAPARLRIGLLLLAQGRRDEARRELQEALRLAPDDPDAGRALGLILNDDAWQILAAGSNEPERIREAVTLAERAADLTQRSDANVLDTLAAAYAASDRFPQAVETARHAERLARERGEEALAGEIGERRSGYEAGQKLREAPLL